jgi:peptidoglycan L-alanyl-D-glutamate endopeptidase CwlK
MEFKLSARSYERLKGVDNRIFSIIELALTITAIDFGIPKYGGLRTAVDQRNLFKAGSTKCDGIEIKSEHQSGFAFDIYAYVDGKASWDRSHLTQVAAAILQAAALLGYPLAWGGLWKSWQDMPHFQLED